MKTIILILICVIFLSGCGPSLPHMGKVIVRDPEGNVLKQYELVLDRPMQMSVTDGEVVIEGDSRCKGLIESLSMSLGLYKSDGGYDYGYDY